MVIADIKLAENISTDVILFNIDSKSEADAKSNKDAIIDVFMKVFNEMQGFCGSLPFLAELERKLTEDGQFNSFKAKFSEISGRKWEDAREEFYFIQDEIVEVLSALGIMSEDAARTWCERQLIHILYLLRSSPIWFANTVKAREKTIMLCSLWMKSGSTLLEIHGLCLTCKQSPKIWELPVGVKHG